MYRRAAFSAATGPSAAAAAAGDDGLPRHETAGQQWQQQDVTL